MINTLKTILQLLILFPILGLVLVLAGCEGDTTNNSFTEPPLPGEVNVQIGGRVGQIGSTLAIAATDTSADPKRLIAFVRWTAVLGVITVVQELGDPGQQVIMSVISGGEGDYIVTQELLDRDARVIEKKDHAVPVVVP